ncbi:hypothetical protein M8C21_016733, partial [Ambrosia artemisiifolia]
IVVDSAKGDHALQWLCKEGQRAKTHRKMEGGQRVDKRNQDELHPTGKVWADKIDKGAVVEVVGDLGRQWCRHMSLKKEQSTKNLRFLMMGYTPFKSESDSKSEVYKETRAFPIVSALQCDSSNVGIVICPNFHLIHHHLPHLRPTERQLDGVFGYPHLARTVGGGSERRGRIASEIRNVLDLIRRGENLRFENVMILDQSVFYGMTGIHDRHRDMRLNIDNMSYEEKYYTGDIMDSGDRLSGLPNDLIHKILSFRSIKDAICTSVLSSRWSSQSLKHLSLTMPIRKERKYKYGYSFISTSTWELPAITKLDLHNVALCDDEAEKCKADISASHPNADKIVGLLQQLRNVHFLTLNLEIIEILSSSMDLILHQPSPFVNLKSLNIYPKITEYQRDHANKKVTMSTELKSYLLDSSPESSFTIVFREEVQAQNIMAELRVLLEKEEDKSKDNKTHVESHKPKKVKLIGEDMMHIKSCLENLGARIEKSCLMISKLQETEALLRKLPASNRAKIQQCFSSLCIEADIAIRKITDCVKIQCDEYQSRSSVWFHELATTSQWSTTGMCNLE